MAWGEDTVGREFYACRMETPERIVCVECGGTAHRSSYTPHEGFEPGDVIAYACEDCDHRHDIILDDDDATTDGSSG